MITRIIYSCVLSLILAKGKCMTNNNFVSRDSVITIYHYKVPCAGENTQWCFLIKINGGEQQNYYGEIQGLNYEWGYRYTIGAEKIQLTNPPADASSFAYKLKKILKKERVPQTTTFSLPFKMNDETLVKKKNGACYLLGVKIIQTGAYSFEDIKRAKSGIFSYKSGKQPGLVLIKIQQ